MCNTNDNTAGDNYNISWDVNFDTWTYFDTTWTTTAKMWYTCPYCNNLIEWFTKFCPQCGNQLIKDPEPTNKEIIEKLDTLIREINELKAKLIK